MNDTVMINDHRLKISTKTVKANGRNYIYYIAKMNLGKDPTTGKQRQHDFTANSKENLIMILERELSSTSQEKTLNIWSIHESANRLVS